MTANLASEELIIESSSSLSLGPTGGGEVNELSTHAPIAPANGASGLSFGSEEELQAEGKGVREWELIAGRAETAVDGGGGGGEVGEEEEGGLSFVQQLGKRAAMRENWLLAMMVKLKSSRGHNVFFSSGGC
ncbi:hypothetical protein HanIR_Chr17g0847391 [Helianthus annuus]|nr:hypothetical protein HanIR_Chr17g0847391 [Helianthus annuus]